MVSIEIVNAVRVICVALSVLLVAAPSSKVFLFFKD